MNASLRFKLVRALAFILVLAIVWIFIPDVWSDWLLAITSIILATAVACFFLWRIKNDPAKSAIGYTLTARTAQLFIAIAAFACCLLTWRKCAMALDLLWCFVLIFNWAMYSSAVEHIEEVQTKHAVSSWYTSTRLKFKELKTEQIALANSKELRSLEEEFRLSNRFESDKTQEVEEKITTELERLSENLNDEEYCSSQIKKIKQLVQKRQIILIDELNSRK